MSECPCGSGSSYEDCCEKFHKLTEEAPTAEKLMRARYSAFVKNEIKYIEQTHEPGTTDFDPKEAEEWATTSTWKGLSIVKTKLGEAENDTGIVEFKCVYADKEGKDYLHHEISTFKKIDNKWFYSNGQIVGTGPIKRETPKVGRNEPCTCGSGKKYKKCCGV